VRIAFDEPRCAAVLLDRKDPSQDGAGRAADRVDAEAIERVVITKQRLSHVTAA